MDPSSPFQTRGQFEAARIMIARLAKELTQELFMGEEIGLNWLPLGDPLIAVTAEGVPVRGTDFVRAGLVLTLTGIIESAQLKGTSVGEAISAMGLKVAQCEVFD